MKVLITGATGFLGSHVAELLRAGGHSVRALVRKSSKVDFLNQLGVELAVANLERGQGLDEAVRGVDAVVHSAGMVKARNAAEFHEVNVGGTVHLLQAVERSAPKISRFVYISSLAAGGFNTDGTPRPNHAEPRPVTEYGRSKLAGELEALRFKNTFPVTVLRPPAIYGPRDNEMFAYFKAISNRVMPFFAGSRESKVSIVYSRDCARAVVDILSREHASGRVYSVEDGNVYTQGELGDMIASALGVRAIPIGLPMPIARLVAKGSELYGQWTDTAVMLTPEKLNELTQPYGITQSEEIRSEIGWKPAVSFSEGAKITAQWYRDNGWL